jgi:antitoxin HicB
VIGQLLPRLDGTRATYSDEFGHSGGGAGADRAEPVSDMAELRYRVILEPEEEGGFTVVIPAFPHGHTQGDSVEEALANAREVILLEIGYLVERGFPIPESDTPNAPIEFVSVQSPAA